MTGGFLRVFLSWAWHGEIQTGTCLGSAVRHRGREEDAGLGAEPSLVVILNKNCSVVILALSWKHFRVCTNTNASHPAKKLVCDKTFLMFGLILFCRRGFCCVSCHIFVWFSWREKVECLWIFLWPRLWDTHMGSPVTLGVTGQNIWLLLRLLFLCSGT